MRVLIVDDEKPIRQWFEMILRTISDISVVGSCANGQDALQFCEKEPVDIVFTDIMMSPMDGITLISKLKAAHPAIEIVILSNYDDFEYVRNGLMNGACDYLLKAKTDDKDIIAMVETLKNKTATTQQDQLATILNKYTKQYDVTQAILPPEGSTEYEHFLKNMSESALFKTPEEPEPLYDSELVNNIIRHINENMGESITLSRISKIFCYNASYISQLFKRVTGQNFNTYVTQIKMKKACEYLLSNKYRIKEISALLGYKNELYFSTVFKSIYHHSPSEWVKSNKTIK